MKARENLLLVSEEGIVHRSPDKKRRGQEAAKRAKKNYCDKGRSRGSKF